GIANRPHIKTHKVPALGTLQMRAGAVGITCQKLGEVEVFTDAGVADDVLLTFNVLGRAKTDRLMALTARLRRLAVALDHAMVVASGTATWDNCAMRVRATVVSRPTPTRAVIDAGTKVLTSDQYTVKGYGHVLEYPEAAVTNLSEEHGIVDLSPCRERPAVGDVVH